MGWFDKVKALFNIEINAPFINITKNSDNTSIDKESVIDDEDRVNIYWDNLSNGKKDELKKIIKESVDEGNLFLEKKSSSLLKDLIDFQKNKGDDKRVLEFFEDAISDEDLEALESSLYLRRKFKEKKEVNHLKEDIRTRFGDRGNNISNMCTAGYFEKYLIPLYNQSKENFKKIYELAVTKSALAIFVHSQMNDEEITNNIKQKLEMSKKYGLKFLHIHGIGEKNIKIIKKCIDENKELFNYYKKEIFEKEGIMVVEILL
jgi:hypothetical protein